MSSNNEAFFSDDSAHPADCLDVKTVQTGRFQTGGPSVMEKEHKLCVEKHQGGGIACTENSGAGYDTKKKKPAQCMLFMQDGDEVQSLVWLHVRTCVCGELRSSVISST